MFNLIDENDQQRINQVQTQFQSMITSKQIKGEEAINDVDVFQSIMLVENENVNCEEGLQIDKKADHTFEEKTVHFKDYGLPGPILADTELVRVQIPGNTAVKINVSLVLRMLKDLIGKDLSKFSMPVFINEPTSLLQKPAEFSFYTNYLTKAAVHHDPVNRMAFVALSLMSGFFTVPKRMGKPFNPLLGETYELVAPDFRYFSEQVSHHPPIACYTLEGLNYEVQRQFETVQQFTGKSVKIYDKNKQKVYLSMPCGMRETYLSKEPMMVVGNLFVGTTYVEPQGPSDITCADTNLTCSVEYKARTGWILKQENENYVSAFIKDQYGTKLYKIEGQYIKELIGTDLRTGEVTTLFRAAEKPQNYAKMFGMNLHALQLNYLPN